LLPERITSLPVLLRPLTAADASRVRELAGDVEVARMTALIPHPYPPDTAATWIATHEQERAAGVAYIYAITRAEDGVLVGSIEWRAAPNAPPSLGYWIGRAYWGHGLATAAARSIIAMAFSRLDHDALSAVHLARNPASGRVLEKCGMSLTGRERRPHRGGPDEDFCVWSITRERWSAVARAL